MSEEVKNDPKRGIKLKGADKTARIPIKVVPLEQKLKKPEWIRAKLPGKKFFEIKIFFANKKCIPCAKKHLVQISANALPRVRPHS